MNCEIMELWNYGTMELWNYGTMELWFIFIRNDCLYCLTIFCII